MIDKDEKEIITEEQQIPKPNSTKNKIKTSFLNSPKKNNKF